MSLDAEAFYALLPAIHRLRDGMADAPGEPLRALLDAIARELVVVDEDIEQLYEDLFIETCADWAIPYIGALVGHQPLRAPEGEEALARAEVAHTIALRRRKGTIAAIEAMARDATGWTAHAVEFFRLLAQTQYTNHVRTERIGYVAVRDVDACAAAGTPFDRLPHTVDVRRIASGLGRHNIPNVGIFLWPVAAWSRTRTPAVAIDDRRLLISPLRCDVPLFHRPQAERSITALATPLATPGPISRRMLAADLASGTPELYGRDEDGQLLGVELVVGGVVVPRERVRSCRLDDDPGSGGWSHVPADHVAVDPERGRLALPPEDAGKAVEVSWHEGFSAAIGGGEYPRSVVVEESIASVPTPETPTIEDAIDQLGGAGTVLLTDNGRHTLPAAIAVTGTLRIVAVEGCRPLLTAEETAVVTGGPDTAFELEGVLLVGEGIAVPDAAGNELARVEVRHTTLVPGGALLPDGMPADPAAVSLAVLRPGTQMTLEKVICGAINLHRHASLIASDSIIDATSRDLPAITGALEEVGGTIELRRVTLVGRISVAEMAMVEDSVLIAGGSAPAIRVERRQQGCVRFSWLPRDAVVPRRFRCLPDEAGRPALNTHSLRYGHPLYARLLLGREDDLDSAASDEDEPGVFNLIGATRRRANLALRLAEHLPAGIDAGIFDVTQGSIR